MKKLKGAYTIEASLILPMILFLMVFSIYAFEWCYNQFVFEAVSLRATNYGASIVGAASEVEGETLRYIQGQMKDSLICGATYRADVLKGNSSVKVSLQGEMKMPFLRMFRSWKLECFQTLEASAERKAIRPASIIWQAQIIGGN